MLQRLIDDVKESTGSALRLTSLAGAAAIALFITTSFLCAAAFLVVLQHYGPVQACLAGAAIFFVVAMIAAISYMMRKRQIRRRAEQLAKTAKAAAATSLLADPMLLATGLQIVRAIGIKRLLPILAIGGVALGIMASRTGAADEASVEPAE